MDKATRRCMAYAGFAGEEGDVEWTLHLQGDQVDLTWQRELDGSPDLIELSMSINDLKRLANAARWILRVTRNDTPLPLSRLASEEESED